MRFLKGVLCLCLLMSFGVSVYAQSFLENAATRRISQETGIPQDLIRTLFVEESNSQFILAFIYINEQTLNGELKPDIKTAITPFVNRNALLILAVPARASFFDPFAISFVQNIFRVSVDSSMITPITTDFTTGTLASGVVSAGIIALDTRVLLNQPFQVQYNASFSATFALTPEAQNTIADDNTSTQGGGIFSGGFRLLLLNLVLLFLFPFLLV